MKKDLGITEAEKQFKELIKKNLKKVPQEDHYNHRMVGSGIPSNAIQYLWQPHNYRLYFDFSKANFNPKKPPNHTLQKHQSMVGAFNTEYTYEPINYNSEHMYEKFMFCTIRVKKTQVEVTNHIYGKQWVLMAADSIDEFKAKVDTRIDTLKKHSIKALKTFIKLHGGESEFKILKERSEHGVKGDDYLDNIDPHLIIHDTYIKKTYLEKPEFTSTPAFKNYVSNRAIEDIAPEIAQELALNRELTKNVLEINASTSKVLNQGAKQMMPILQDFSLNIKTHNKVLKAIDKSFRKFNQLLKKGEQKKLGDFFI